MRRDTLQPDDDPAIDQRRSSPEVGDQDQTVVDDTEERLQSVDPVVRRRIQDWAKRLIDLSRRNRLLYFRPTKRTTLHLVAPSASEIATKLLQGGSWHFYEPRIGLEGDPFTTIDEALALAPAGAREVVAERVDPKELQRSLEVVSRRARAEFEDRGTHVLQLAFGMVYWREDDAGDESRSPLLLIPCEISRESARDPWILRAADDDPFVNPALRVKLQSDFGLELRSYDDFEDLDLKEVLAEAQDALKPDWRVEPAAYVGIYGFAKEAIYRDLLDHIDAVAEDSQVQTLAHGEPVGETRGALSVAVPDESQLDRVQDPATTLSVLDADSSQREAIEAAVAGLSFVMQGPPGTGKSQTIANVIAEFIGRGRSVLFVSEKIAALEVVANRLEAAGLEDLFLELHSHKASRREVAYELGRVLDEDVIPNADLSPAELDLLRNARTQLNEYVESLHLIRQPYGRSVRDVLGELASLANVPGLPSAPIDSATATGQDLIGVEGLIGRMAAVWAPAEPGTYFAWRGASHTHFGAAERDNTLERLRGASESLERLAGLDQRISEAFGTASPATVAARGRFIALADLVTQPAQVPSNWLMDANLELLDQTIREWSERTAERREHVETLQDAYGDSWFEVPASLEAQVIETSRELAEDLGVDGLDSVGIVAELASVRSSAEQLPAQINEATSLASDLAPRLGISAPMSARGYEALAAISRGSQARYRPPADWLVRSRREQVQQFLLTEGPTYTMYQEGYAALQGAYFVDQLLEVELETLVPRLERQYGRWWSFLSSSYRRDRGTIRALRRDGRLSAGLLEDVHAARLLSRQRDHLAGIASEATLLLGPYFDGLATNVAAAGEALRLADGLAQSDTVADWGRVSAAATFEAPYDAEIDREGEKLERVAASIKAAMTSLALGSDARLERWRTADQRTVVVAASRLSGSAAKLIGDLSRVGAPRRHPIDSLEVVVQELGRRADVDRLDADLAHVSSQLANQFGAAFRAWDTNWDGLTAALEWATAVRDAFGGGSLTTRAAGAVLDGSAVRLPWEAYREAIESAAKSVADVKALFDESHGTVIESSLGKSPTEAVAALRQLELRVDEVGTWVAFRDARAAAQAAGWGAFVERAEQAVPGDSLLPAARRAWLEAWVESVIGADTHLKPFTRKEHDRLRRAFGELDVASIHAARERVLAAYARGKPDRFAVQGGEQAVVRREAAKRRRHIPVRRLFSQIPNLLPRIKPCLMMSPLSVSHYLPADVRFDLVVFDEASQVPPEDAINCIYRGAQLIVAGDQHQLPPTDFFQVAAESEVDDEAEVQVDDFESVLDVCRASGFRVVPLRWHYRSRHDELIAFSNHYIYDNSLVTFPSALEDHAVRLEFVPEGVFDRGRTSKNRIEASRVADVLATLLAEGHRSIGIVAFSMAQQEAINDELERRRSVDERLDELLHGDRLSGVFVKNLETVQGDERDYIVFSIGYGRDAGGRFLMNFGPLNRQGGKRRLNVAVTRAREQVIVVSSVRAADFGNPESDGGPKSEGPRLLQAYLDYAERGAASLLDHLDASQGDFESPFEREVAGVIRSFGFDAVPQVGASRYRIDIGVRSRVIPGRFVVGVECDGAMYHSAKTARDRDRLRQRVLENLGWQIYRIWSQDWFNNRGTEQARLKAAIERAEEELSAGAKRGSVPQDEDLQVSSAAASRERVARPPLEVSGAADALSLRWTEPYHITALAPYQAWGEFHDWSMLDQHASRVAALVAGEGPLHEDYIASRLARAFGLARTGSRIRGATHSAIQRAETAGQVQVKGPFIWPKVFTFERVRVPVPGVDETHRDISEIPPEEVDLAVLRVAEAALSVSEPALITQVARVLGFERTGDHVGELIGRRVRANLKNGSLATEGTNIVLKAELPPLAPLPAEGATRPPRLGQSLDGFFPGQRVIHSRFGVGTIRDVGSKYVTVAFGEVVKDLDPSLAQLTPEDV